MLRGDWERDPLLPRAFSLLSVDLVGGTAEVLAKTVGRGTALLERAGAGEDDLGAGPLGTSFPAPSPEHADLLVAGGGTTAHVHAGGPGASQAGLVSRKRNASYGGAAAPTWCCYPR